MAKSFSNWGQLEQYLKKQIDETLNQEVARQVKEEIQTTVSTEVYGAGSPVKYERRGGNDYGGMGNPIGTGSLGDVNEMDHQVKNGELTVVNNAERNTKYKFAGIGYDLNKSLAFNIEYGYGAKDKWFNQARPFMSEAVKNMKETKSHVDAMKDGLEKRLGKGTVI